MSDPATSSTPAAQAAPGRTARETIAESVAQISQALNDLTGQRMDALAARGNTEPCRIARSALALRALLDTPPGAVERLCEAAGQTLVMLKDRTGKATISTEPLTVALAALRASPESIGTAPPDIERLLAAERVRTAEAIRERDFVRADLVSIVKERDAFKADLAAARAEIMRLRADRDRAAMPTTANASAAPDHSPDAGETAATYADFSVPPEIAKKRPYLAAVSVPTPADPPEDRHDDAPIPTPKSAPAWSIPLGPVEGVSERARWIADAAVQLAVRDCEGNEPPWLMRAGCTGERETEACANYARYASKILAAAERAASATQEGKSCSQDR